MDAHRDRVRGVLLREAWPARHLPQSGKDSRLDIALGELSLAKSDPHHSSQRAMTVRNERYVCSASVVLSGHKEEESLQLPKTPWTDERVEECGFI